MIVLKQEINKGVSTRPFYAKINFFETCFWTPREAMDLCFWTFTGKLVPFSACRNKKSYKINL